VELERMDAMIVALWPKVEKGDVQSVQAALGVMTRRAKLLGLDAPSKQESKNEHEHTFAGKAPEQMSMAEIQAEALRLAENAMAATGSRLPDRDPEDGNAK
jgi:hypothetical protein